MPLEPLWQNHGLTQLETIKLEKQNQPVTQMPLEHARPHIGDAVQIIAGGASHVATLIGYFKGQSFIVTLPEHGGFLPRLGQHPVVVRFTSDKRPYEFSTTIRHVANEPFPHLHLDYPNNVQALKERRHERIKINISGVADLPSGETLSCTVRDISMGGALVAVETPTGRVSDQLMLTLKVTINGVEYRLSLDSEIRSIRIGNTPDNRDSNEVLHGLAFRDLSEKDILALAAFDLLPDWNPAAT